MRQYSPWQSYDPIDAFIDRLFVNEMFIADQIVENDGYSPEFHLATLSIHARFGCFFH